MGWVLRGDSLFAWLIFHGVYCDYLVICFLLLLYLLWNINALAIWTTIVYIYCDFGGLEKHRRLKKKMLNYTNVLKTFSFIETKRIRVLRTKQFARKFWLSALSVPILNLKIQNYYYGRRQQVHFHIERRYIKISFDHQRPGWRQSRYDIQQAALHREDAHGKSLPTLVFRQRSQLEHLFQAFDTRSSRYSYTEEDSSTFRPPPRGDHLQTEALLSNCEW